MAKRVVLPAVGAVPLALVVGCSSTTNQAGHSSTSESSTSTAPTDQAPAPYVPGTSVPPSSNPQQKPSVGPTTTSQPGVTPTWPDSLYTPGTVQPGVVQPSVPQPGVVAPLPNYVVPPDFRPVPEAEYTEPAPAVNLMSLHAPEQVTPVKPIAPPPRTLRLGNFSSPVPDFVPENLLDQVNVTAATGEANISTDLNSVGINPSRSDKIAAGALAGAGAGALIAGVPAAAVGGVVGGVIGGVVGTTLAAGTVVAVPVGTVAGAAIGAAAGAAVAGIPVAVVGGAVGGLVGAAIGSAI